MEKYSGLNEWFGLQQYQIDDIKKFIHSRICKEKHNTGHYCYRMSQEKFDQMKEDFDLSTMQLESVLRKICREKDYDFNLAQLVIYPIVIRKPFDKDVSVLSIERIAHTDVVKLCNKIDRLIVMRDIISESRNFTENEYENSVRIPIEPLCEDVLWPDLDSDFTIPLDYVDIIKAWYTSIGFIVTDESYNGLKIAWKGTIERDMFVADIWLVPKGQKIALH